MSRATDYATIYLRIALSAAFLSAVADRFGGWGPPGASGVAWGNFASFVDYTAAVNPYLPARVIPLVGWTVSVAEVLLALALLVGLWVRWTALASSALLLAFAVGMTVGTGIKSPLDASVFTASAGALLLAGARRYPWSLDAVLGRGGQATPRATGADQGTAALAAEGAATPGPENGPNR